MFVKDSNAARLSGLIDTLRTAGRLDLDPLPEDTEWRRALRAAEGILDVLQPRVVIDPDGGMQVAVTVEGLDLYVRRSPDGRSRTVSVGIDDLPQGVTAVVESSDGVSWEQELP